MRARLLAAAVLGLTLLAGPLPAQAPAPDFERMRRQQAATDAAFQTASVGFMHMEKISYRSRVGDLVIPAFVFQPLAIRGEEQHPALVWVHENVRGRLYEHY